MPPNLEINFNNNNNNIFQKQYLEKKKKNINIIQQVWLLSCD